MEEQKRTPPPGGSQRTKNQRIFTVRFTLPKLVFGVLLTLMLFAWSFIFGIILGRGMSPEDSIPHIAKALPRPLEPVTADTNQGLLKPEEFAYFATLKGRDAQRPTPSRTQTAGSSTQKPNPTALTAPQPQAPGSVPAAQKPVSTPQTAQASQSRSETPAQNSGEQFDYVYQVAAFKDAASADRLLGKLKQQRLQAETLIQTQDNTTWYRTIVHFKGTPEDTRQLRETLATLGIHQILLRSKAPIKR